MQLKKSILVLLLTIPAFILRTILNLNLNISADEAVYVTHCIDIPATKLNLISGGIIYCRLLDIGYKLFGVSAFSARLPNIIFGAFAVILVYLIGSEFFDKKKAVIASFLFAISGYAIRANTEPDMPMIFFSLFFIYFFIKGMKYNEKNFYLAALFLGIAILVKPIALLVGVAAVIYYLNYNSKFYTNKKTLKTIILSVILLIIILSPALVYNYLLYKDKGRSDVYFAQYLGVNKEEYAGLGMEKGWKWDYFSSSVKGVFNRFLLYDFIIFGLALAGLGLCFKRKLKFTGLFVLSILIPTLFLLGTSRSTTHYTLLFPFFCLFAAETIWTIKEKIDKEDKKKIIFIILVAIAIANIFLIRTEMFNKAAIVELREHTSKIPEDSLVVYDFRIYRGLGAWALNDKHYLESSYFKSMLAQMEQLPGQPVQTEVYFIECVKDDCQWGRGLLEDEKQQAMGEEVVSFFEKDSIKLAEITDDWQEGKPLYYRIYKKDMLLNPIILDAVDSTHTFYYYPIRWKITENVFDDYATHNSFDSFLNLIALLVVWLTTLIAILSPLYAVYLLYKNDRVQ